MADAAASAAKVSQEAATDAAKATREYAAAGAQKTQEAFNEYVRRTRFRLTINKFINYLSGCTCCYRYNECSQRESCWSS